MTSIKAATGWTTTSSTQGSDITVSIIPKNSISKCTTTEHQLMRLSLAKLCYTCEMHCIAALCRSSDLLVVVLQKLCSVVVQGQCCLIYCLCLTSQEKTAFESKHAFHDSGMFQKGHMKLIFFFFNICSISCYPKPKSFRQSLFSSNTFNATHNSPLHTTGRCFQSFKKKKKCNNYLHFVRD